NGAGGGGFGRPSSSKKRRPRRRDQQTVRHTTRANVTHSAEVLNWVQPLTRAGYPTKEIVALSRVADDWPLPGEPLTDGTLATVRSAILHLEMQGARFPLPADGGALRGSPKKKATELGRRLHRASAERGK